MPAVRDWDGRCYDRISGPMESLGRAVLERLVLQGDETVLDAGCGSGRITQALIARLPRGRVIGVDASASMIEAAARRLPAGTELRVADLVRLELDDPVDAILSTATFHWILDHPQLFGRLRAVLRDGGRLTAQCGGEGNVTVLRAASSDVLARPRYAPHFRDFEPPWNYAGPEITRERLLAAGFSEADCWLAPAPRQPEHPHEFLSQIVLGPHVQHLPEELRRPFIDDVIELLGDPVTVDYVRLNIDAIA